MEDGRKYRDCEKWREKVLNKGLINRRKEKDKYI
jgi:hypothetical protein